MGEVKEINIENQSYYFFGDMILIKNRQEALMKTLIFTILATLQLRNLVIVKIFRA